MATTRKDLRQRIGSSGFCNDTVIGTATSGGLGTLSDTSLKQPDSFFNYGQIVILTGAAAGDRRYVSSWTQSTSTIVADRNFSAAISTNQYELHRLWSADEKDKAINEAIRLAGVRFPRRIEDSSLSLSNGVYTYSLDNLTVPVDPEIGIDQIEYDSGIVTGTGVPYSLFEDDYWHIRNNDGTLTLQLDALPRLKATTMRLTYRVRPSDLNADTDVLKPDVINFANFICAKATAILFDKMALKAGQDAREHWQVEAQKMHQLAEAYYGADKPQTEPGKVIFGKYGNANDVFAKPILYGE
jgi:hypothetical protein